MLHQAHYVQDRKCADAVGNKVGSVLGEDNTLSEANVGEPGNRFQQRAVSFGGGNNLKQPHVARRVEEVGSEPAAAKVVREALSDLGDRQAAGIRSDDRSRPA